MQKDQKYYDVSKSKIYKNLYRPSTNFSRFFKVLWGILVVGDSPISKNNYYKAKKSR